MGLCSSKCKHERYSVPDGSPPPAYAPGGFAAFKSPTMKFRAISDQYTTLTQVQEALRKGGLESSNLIVAVDFTKSNEWTGKHSFGGRSLHAIGSVPSPYEEAISVIGRTLSTFDDDGFIPCYGFGDATTGDQSVFSFLPGDQPCQGLQQALLRYRELCPHVRMAGPTSFAPAIRQASRIVEASGGQYHILLLVADGQVTRPAGMPSGSHSEQERATIDAIVEASHLPLSIVMVGVGDGPWDLMRDFDDELPQRKFDNFQFVNFTELAASTAGNPDRRAAQFALRALMEVPEQFSAIQRLGLLGSSAVAAAARNRSSTYRATLPRDPPQPPPGSGGGGGGAARSSLYGVKLPPLRTPVSGSALGSGSGNPTLQSSGGKGGAGTSCGACGSGDTTNNNNNSNTGAAAAGGSAGGKGGKAVTSGSAATPGKGSSSSSGNSSCGAAPPGARAAAAPGRSSWDAGASCSAAGASGGVSAAADAGGASGAGGSGGAEGADAAAEPTPDPMFLCPITQDVMEDPVIATDGYTYERSAITKWLAQHATSPLTNKPMPGNAMLIPNHGLRSAIMEWKQKTGQQ